VINICNLKSMKIKKCIVFARIRRIYFEELLNVLHCSQNVNNMNNLDA